MTEETIDPEAVANALRAFLAEPAPPALVNYVVSLMRKAERAEENHDAVSGLFRPFVEIAQMLHADGQFPSAIAGDSLTAHLADWIRDSRARIEQLQAVARAHAERADAKDRELEQLRGKVKALREELANESDSAVRAYYEGVLEGLFGPGA